MVGAQIVLLAAVTVAAYYPAITGKFIWDDDKYVEDNKTLRTPHGLWNIWTRPRSIPQYYPLVHTTFWVEYHIWGANPLPYHLDNVLLHIGGALLFWLVLRRLGLRGGAYAAALLFAVHPIMVESAGWITERKNVLSLVFYLGAMLAYLRFDPLPRDAGPPQSRSWPHYALALLLFVCALLCKTVTATLPVVLLLVSWWKNWRKPGTWTQLLTPLILVPAVLIIRLWSPTGDFQGIPHTASLLETFEGWRGTSVFPTWFLPWAILLQVGILVFFWFIRRSVPWTRAACLLPMLAVGATFGFTTAWLETHHVGAEGMEWDMNRLGHILLAGRVPWFYLGKLLWPAPIIFFYPRWTIDPSQWWQYLHPAAAVGLVAALWLLRKRIGRGPLTAVLCFGVSIFPALGFANVYPMRFSYVADHFQYHASLAIFALVAAVAGRGVAVLRRRMAAAGPAADRGPRYIPFAAGACLLAVAGALACLSWRQANDYKDIRTLWTNTIRKNPQSWISMHNLACLRMDDAFRDPNGHDLKEAINLFRRALIVYAGGDPDRAPPEEVQDVRDWLSRAGGDANRVYDDVLVNFGIICLRKGNAAQAGGYPWLAQDYVRQAHDYFHQALAVRPRVVGMRNRLGKIICEGGRPLDALPYFEEALAIDPNSADAYYNTGFVWATQRQNDKAIGYFEKAIALRPDHAESHFTLGQLFTPKDPERALREFRLAVEYDPEHVLAMDRMAGLLNGQNRFAEALQMARKAIDLDGNLPSSLTIAAAVLSSHPDANFRNGRLAVKYATRLCRITNNSDAGALDVLAGAYAEVGDYAQAVETAQRAIDLARAGGLWDWARQFSDRQEDYRKNRPFRRPTGR